MPYSSSRQVPLCRLAECAMWGGVVLLLATATVVGIVVGTHWFPAVIALVAHGLALSAASATVSIRNRLLMQESLLRDAFTMGRETASVRPLGRNQI